VSDPSLALAAPNNHHGHVMERMQAMWDTAPTNEVHLSHDMQCARCGHEVHTFLACGTNCACGPVVMPGA